MGIARIQLDSSNFIRTKPESIWIHSTFYVHVTNRIINHLQSHRFLGAMNHSKMVGLWQPGFPTHDSVFFPSSLVIPRRSHGRFWAIFGPACSGRTPKALGVRCLSQWLTECRGDFQLLFQPWKQESVFFWGPPNSRASNFTFVCPLLCSRYDPLRRRFNNTFETSWNLGLVLDPFLFPFKDQLYLISSLGEPGN